MNRASNSHNKGRVPPGIPQRGESTGQMAVITETLPVKTSGNGQMIDLTAEIGRILKKNKLRSGIVTIFVPGSTASITTIEFEPGLKQDFPDALERLAPKDIPYQHDKTWHDGNGHSHVRASIIGPSLTVPFDQGILMLGTWQQIIISDWDNKTRYRDIVLQFMGVKG